MKWTALNSKSSSFFWKKVLSAQTYSQIWPLNNYALFWLQAAFWTQFLLIFSSAEHLSGVQRSELHQGSVFENKSHFVSRGTLRYRAVRSFAETVAMLLSEFIWNRQVVEEIMERRAVHQMLLSCLGYICIWWLEFLKLKKKNKNLNSASYAYSNIPFPISQIIYFHHQCTGWFSHPFPMFQSYQGSIATLIFCAKFLKTYTPFLFWNST